MKSRYTVSMLSAVAVAAVVASAFAQQSATQSGSSDRQFAADQVPNPGSPAGPRSQSPSDTFQQGGFGGRGFRRAGDLFQTGRGPFGTVDPAQRKLAADEAAIASRATELTRQLEAAGSDTSRNEIKAKLREVLGNQFDARQKRHNLEIEALEAQIKKLKDLVQKRQENRVEIIARRFEQIVRESEGLGF